MKQTLTAILIAKDAANTIGDALASLDFCSEIIVLDSGSTDTTVEIARSFGARVIITDWPGFGIQKQRAVQAVRTTWALSIDCDEVVSKSLRQEIENTLEAPQYDIYRMPRLNHFCRRPVHCAGWYPDYVVRLFRMGNAHFSESTVHESLCYDSACGTLSSPLLHYTCDSIEEAVRKLNLYSSLSASMQRRKGSSYLPPLKFLSRFLYAYLIRNGWRGGLDGFTVSLFQAFEVYLKYLKAMG